MILNIGNFIIKTMGNVLCQMYFNQLKHLMIFKQGRQTIIKEY